MGQGVKGDVKRGSGSSLVMQWVKDPALPVQFHCCLLWGGFDPWRELTHAVDTAGGGGSDGCWFELGKHCAPIFWKFFP